MWRVLTAGMRYLFAAAASAFVLPMANAIGWGLTMTVASIIVVRTAFQTPQCPSSALSPLHCTTRPPERHCASRRWTTRSRIGERGFLLTFRLSRSQMYGTCDMVGLLQYSWRPGERLRMRTPPVRLSLAAGRGRSEICGGAVLAETEIDGSVLNRVALLYRQSLISVQLSTVFRPLAQHYHVQQFLQLGR
jgi:hypothetical protein